VKHKFFTDQLPSRGVRTNQQFQHTDGPNVTALYFKNYYKKQL